MDIEEVKQALARTEQTLSTAHFGLNILNSGPPEQKSAGLRNVLVFGRSVTFVIQNLKLLSASKSLLLGTVLIRNE
ncbi:hypothetical protein [Pseudomonas syringae]|uniref:hypothetical protein n=1 Tax=Pseudomonas TaxID=286 RepID=UPI0011AEE887|nr:hypothetical protein [Pseudomonas syringae]MCH5527908.1 hypothetical protein [Pseudomonas syringae pv. syringae]MCH5537815.1 hypothetical protein [Pseudomonas syringae pv. syringae]MCH5542830.1 hypothetical protein [Pseudomonas syringae pv. syringae]MCH5601310.1 hypothetical protein [Pseudomonas syringae pv. syringae]MCH5606222.1 hypothetical protein [Pseudomonas syringae pv. syringae]